MICIVGKCTGWACCGSPFNWGGVLGLAFSESDRIKFPKMILDNSENLSNEWFPYDGSLYLDYTLKYVFQIPNSNTVREEDNFSEEDILQIKLYEELLSTKFFNQTSLGKL